MMHTYILVYTCVQLIVADQVQLQNKYTDKGVTTMACKQTCWAEPSRRLAEEIDHMHPDSKKHPFFFNVIATVVRKLKPTHPEWIVPAILFYFPKLGTPYGQSYGHPSPSIPPQGEYFCPHLDIRCRGVTVSQT